MMLGNTKAVRGKLGGLAFQFNPTQIQEDGGKERTNITSANLKPILITTGIKPKTLSFELYFNDRYSTAHANEVRKVLETYRDYVEPLNLILGKFYSGKVKIISAPCTFEEFEADFKVTAFKTPIVVQEV